MLEWYKWNINKIMKKKYIVLIALVYVLSVVVLIGVVYKISERAATERIEKNRERVCELAAEHSCVLDKKELEKKQKQTVNEIVEAIHNLNDE